MLKKLFGSKPKVSEKKKKELEKKENDLKLKMAQDNNRKAL